MASPVIQFKRGLLANLPGLRAGEPGFTTDSYDLYVGIDSTTTNNKFFGSHRYWTKETSSTGSGVNFVEGTSNGAHYVTLKAPDSFSGITTFTLPSADGINGQVLATNGSGTLSFINAAANLNIAGGVGTDTVSLLSDTLTFAGTANEIETTVTNNQVQIGLPNDVTIGNNLYVSGVSTFVGAVTFQGGTINLGDANTDDINVAGEFVSNLIPNATNTYDLGTSSKRWKDAFYSGNVDITGTLNVDGNVTIGGTAVTLLGQDVYVENKDIILGYTTSVSPNDDTANHAGVAIASTVGSPLVSFSASGINTLPDTYKQMMWFHSGTLGFGTDAFAFNYGVAIGTTTMADGVRLAVGSGVTISDTSISATNFYGTVSTANQVKTVNAADTNATYYVTFVDANNGSATAENVYTDDGIYYNPGTNTFTTQNGLFTGNVTVNGTLTGTATTATRATLIDTANTTNNSDYYVTFVDTLAGQGSENLRVGLGLSVNPSNGNVKTTGTLSVGDPAALTSYIKAGGGSNALYLYGNGDVSFQAKAIVNEIRSSNDSNTLITLSGLDATFARDVAITGITTVGTLKLSGTSGIGITGISASTSLAENSNAYLPTQAAVKAYVDSVDLTTGIAGDTGTGSVSTSQTLTVAGTANQVATSASGQTITVSLPTTVIVGTAVSAPTLRASTLQHENGTQAATIDSSGNLTASQNLTIAGNLYVNGSTTQVNTASMTVEDRTIELGVVDGSAPSSSTTWDLGVLFNYYDGSAKKSALIWEQGDARFKLGSVVADGGGTGSTNPQITFTTYAPLEIGGLWVNDCAGQSQVIACSGSTRTLENITIDGGAF